MFSSLAAGSAAAAPGAWRTVGKPGEWANTVVGTMHGDKLYTVERDGGLYATTPATGVWSLLGKLNIGKIKWLVSGGDKLWAITPSGGLYSVDATNGATIRGPRDWRDTVAAGAFAGRLYTIEKSGRLYVTDLAKAQWKPIGEPDIDDARYLVADDSALFDVEKDGTMYRIEASSGKWRTIGKPGEFENTIAVALLGGVVYTIDKAGQLYETDAARHSTRAIGGQDFADTVVLVAGKQTLFCVEKDGSLYEINVK
jgi:sugar lactone lactonase YvrE